MKDALASKTSFVQVAVDAMLEYFLVLSLEFVKQDWRIRIRAWVVSVCVCVCVCRHVLIGSDWRFKNHLRCEHEVREEKASLVT